MIKRIVSFTAAIILFAACFTVGVSAASREYNITFDSGFTVGYADGSLREIAKTVGKSEAELKSYCQSNGILFIAANADNSVQMRLARFKNEFSVKARSINSLDSEGLELFAQSISAGGEYTVYKTENSTFLKFKTNLSDSGGEYVSTQYVTLENENIYQISCYNSGSDTDLAAQAAVDSFSLSLGAFSGFWQQLAVAVVIAVFCAVIVFMVIGIIKDMK